MNFEGIDSSRIEIFPIKGKYLNKKKKKKTVPTILKVYQWIFGNLGDIFSFALVPLAGKIFSRPFFKPRMKDQFNEMTKAEQMWVIVGGLKIKTYVWSNSGPTVLLVHGWESRSSYLSAFVAPLRDHGFQVVAFDGKAHGLSEGKGTTIISNAECIEVFCNKFGNIETIIGHSFGGATSAFSLARANLNIKNLILIGTPVNITRIFAEFVELLTASDMFLKKLIHLFEKRFQIKMIDTHTDVNLRSCNVENVLIVHDVDDDIVPFEDVEKMLMANSKAVLLQTHGYGHSMIKTDLKVVKRIVEWLID